MEFIGKLTMISDVRSGEGKSGNPWANLKFEVTESSPNNPDYPQIGSFDYFKSKDFVKYVNEFSSNFAIGDEVRVEFNLKKSVYNKKDGSGEGVFYSTPCWKIEKTAIDISTPKPLGEENEEDGLPF